MAFSMEMSEINSRTKFNTCYERMMVAKYFGIKSFCDLIWMTSALALHALRFELQVSQTLMQ